MIPATGSHLAHYRLVEKIGEGGMGVVFKALDTRLERHVALKLLRPELTADAERRRRFVREARTAAAVTHPNIAVIHQIDEADGIAFIVMELVEGRSLRGLIEERTLGLEEALRIAAQVAEGMARAHQSRIIHRDLKPDNVILGTDGRARILDFGLARILEEAEGPLLEAVDTEAAVTRDASAAGRLLGTAPYMSPEQARGEVADARSDVFSFGVLLYEMLTGRKPFAGRTVTATLARVLESEPISPSLLRPDLPEEVEAIIARCLQKQPEARFEDAARLAEAIGAVLRRQAILEPPPERAEISPNKVAVFPFPVRGGPEFSYLGPGIVDLLSTKLDGAGDLRSVDPHVILCCLEAVEPGASDPQQALRIAHRFGAGQFVLGNILEAGGQLHIDASLYDASGAGRVLARAAVRGDAGRIFEMVDQLFAELVASRVGGPGARLERIAAMATGSFTALKAYLEGESEMRAMRRDAAAQAYGRAVQADPGFALAWYRLAVASLWSGHSGTAIAAAREAVRHSGRLSERDRMLLEAFESALKGANEEAERRYRTIVGAYPDDVEAWYQLGELQFHTGPLRGRPIEESRGSWERLLFLDPRHVNGMVHLGVIAASVGDQVRLESLLKRVQELSPQGDLTPPMRAFRSFCRDHPEQTDRLLRDLGRAGDYGIAFAAQFLGAYLSNPEAAFSLAGLLCDPVRLPEVHALGRVMRAHLQLSLGRPQAARRELEEAARRQPALAALHRGVLAAALFLPPDPPELAAALEQLEELPQDDDPHAADAGGSWIAPHQGLQAALRSYVRGALLAALGRPEEALECAVRLRASPEPPHGGSLVHDLACSVMARSALARGRHMEALALLEATRMQARFDLVLWSPFFSQSAERYLRAELLWHLGRLEEAAVWYASFAQNSIYDQIYLPASHLRRAEIRARLSQPLEAAQHLAAAGELWRGAEPEIRARLDEVRARVARFAE